MSNNLPDEMPAIIYACDTSGRRLIGSWSVSPVRLDNQRRPSTIKLNYPRYEYIRADLFTEMREALESLKKAACNVSFVMETDCMIDHIEQFDEAIKNANRLLLKTGVK